MLCRSLAESNYTKSYELQNDLCQKRIDAHKGMLRLSLIAAQVSKSLSANLLRSIKNFSFSYS